MSAFEKRLEQRFESVEDRMRLQFEDTRGLIRLSFEAVEALRESTDRGFAEMREQHAEQTALLHTAIKHVRRRVEILERAPRAKRSR